MRALLTSLGLVLLLWLGGFAWFLAMLSTQPPATADKADAIIVLTGANGRVEQGLVELGQGNAPVLFISGVGRSVTLTQMVRAHSTPEIRQHIAEHGGEVVLGYQANSTQSNAAEVAAFVADRDLHSIRLITSHYHMPRSLLEFRMALPQVIIFPDPVLPEPEGHHWCLQAGSLRLAFSEYHKYLAAWLLQYLDEPPVKHGS